MPANLTAQYLKAEEAYRRATSLEEELKCLQVMLQEIPKHKGTDHLQADLKSKMAKLKREMASEKGAGKKKGRGLRIPRQGAGTAILLGGPNAGKSQLIASLTHATPEVAPYPFTTHTPAPAMMPLEDVSVQLIDTPPITADFIDPHLYGLIRAADLALLMVDLGSDDGIEQCQEVLDRLAGIEDPAGGRLVPRRERRGALLHADLSRARTRSTCPRPPAGWNSCTSFARWISPNTSFPPPRASGWRNSARRFTSSLDVVRVYSKLPTAKEADRDRPFTLRRGGTLLEMAGLVHKDFLTGLKFARVWGEAVHDGTAVKGDYVLHDKDVVELHMCGPLPRRGLG